MGHNLAKQSMCSFQSDRLVDIGKVLVYFCSPYNRGWSFPVPFLPHAAEVYCLRYFPELGLFFFSEKIILIFYMIG